MGEVEDQKTIEGTLGRKEKNQEVGQRGGGGRGWEEGDGRTEPE